jgi:hypothetical protein
MTPIAGRYQPLEAARPGMPLRVRDLQTAQTLLLREASCRPEEMAAAFSRARTSMGIFHPRW